MRTETELARCPVCCGSGERLFECTSCGGSGESECEACGGHAVAFGPWDSGPSFCPECRGSGYHRCEACCGRGHTPEKCDICAGTGTLTREDAEVLAARRNPSRWRDERPPAQPLPLPTRAPEQAPQPVVAPLL